MSSSARMKSATTGIVARLRAGAEAREMTNVNRSVLMADAADTVKELVEVADDALDALEDASDLAQRFGHRQRFFAYQRRYKRLRAVIAKARGTDR